MKKIHAVSIMLIVLLILAEALVWGTAWKWIIGLLALYLLVLIGLEIWKRRK